jgi:hypothetical protein
MFALVTCSVKLDPRSDLHTNSFTLGPYSTFHGMALLCHIEGFVITAVWTHLRMFLNSYFHNFLVSCWILLKPVLWGVYGSLQFPVSSINRLNQTEPAALSMLPCWACRNSAFPYMYFILPCFIWQTDYKNRQNYSCICRFKTSLLYSYVTISMIKSY